MTTLTASDKPPRKRGRPPNALKFSAPPEPDEPEQNDDAEFEAQADASMDEEDGRPMKEAPERSTFIPPPIPPPYVRDAAHLDDMPKSTMQVRAAEEAYAFNAKVAADGEVADLLQTLGAEGLEYKLDLKRDAPEFHPETGEWIGLGFIDEYRNRSVTRAELSKLYGGGKYTISVYVRDPKLGRMVKRKDVHMEIAGYPNPPRLKGKLPQSSAAEAVVPIVKELVEASKEQASVLRSELQQQRREGQTMMEKMMEIMAAKSAAGGGDLAELMRVQMQMAESRRQEEKEDRERRDREELGRKDREREELRALRAEELRREEVRRQEEREARQAELAARREAEAAKREDDRRRYEEERAERQRQHDKELEMFKLQMTTKETSTEMMMEFLKAQVSEAKTAKNGLSEALMMITQLKDVQDTLSGANDKEEGPAGWEKALDKVTGLAGGMMQQWSAVQQSKPPPAPPQPLPKGVTAVAELSNPPPLPALSAAAKKEEAPPAEPKNEYTGFAYPLPTETFENQVIMLAKNIDYGIAMGHSVPSIMDQVIMKFPPLTLGTLKAMNFGQWKSAVEANVPKGWVIRQSAGMAVLQNLHTRLQAIDLTDLLKGALP